MDDWANPVSTNNRPDKERNARKRNEKGFDSEEMANLVDGKPNRWQRTEPKNDEAGKIAGVGSRSCRKVIRDVFIIRPDRSDNECDAFACQKC